MNMLTVTYWQLWWIADGTPEYGQAIRWHYLLGGFGIDPKASKLLEKLDNRNYKKWAKDTELTFDDYLDVTRV